MPHREKNPVRQAMGKAGASARWEKTMAVRASMSSATRKARSPSFKSMATRLHEIFLAMNKAVSNLENKTENHFAISYFVYIESFVKFFYA
uniref:Uncharacterized protein n=1 Tax=Acrobeloides nanus TaxID=290746 RepID=A0A914ENK9_9BILA